jgi:class 3 adenylate cyclase/tetratricopeptide (TPR) repeat protein
MSLRAYAAMTATGWDARALGRTSVRARGSLLKIDLSGFTRLSERLAVVESTGAEHLNTVLTEVFTDLIEEVLSRGGDVLQFGGDALLVWFEGDRCEVRAVAAGRAMQRVLSSRPAEQTPAGAVRLRMSAAVATGELVLVVVGSDHRELLTLGPVATRVEQLEKRAAAGDLLVDDATAEQLPTAQVSRVEPGVWHWRGRPAEHPVDRTPLAADSAADFVPPEVRAVEAAGPVLGEHRHAAVAFIGVGGLDDLLAQRGDGAVAERVREVAAAVDEAVETTGVVWTATDLMADGAVFLLFSGAPVAREGDEERLLRACRHVADRCAGTGVRIGAHAGRVFAADIGHPQRRTFAAIGDTTNLAARLMHRAAPGEVLVSQDLVDLSERDHAVTWLEPFDVRGRRRPVTAGRLGGRLAQAPQRRLHDLPLVGREEERARLRSVVDGLLQQRGDAPTLMVGDPGVGKSRLVDDLCDHAAPRVTVLRGTGGVFDRGTPYAATAAGLRALLVPDGGQPDLAWWARLSGAPDLLPLLNLPLGLDVAPTVASAEVDPRFVESRRNELLADLLVGVAAPLLVVVEDLHWVDSATVGLLDALVRRSRQGGAAVVATSRPGSEDRLETLAEWGIVPVTPLSAANARDLALAVPGDRAISDADLGRLVEESGGNPLFLRELVTLDRHSGDDLPTSAESLIAARIDSLGPARRRLLREASVGGPAQRLADLAAANGTSVPAMARDLASVEQFVLVHEGEVPVVRFRHELYRQTAYLGLALRRRRALHAAWADRLLEVDHGSPAVLAVHLSEAGRFEEAWEWGTRAARLARDGGALHDAVALYERALAAGRRTSRSPEELAAVEEELGDVAELTGGYERADSALAAAARTGEPATRAHRLVKRATVLERQARYSHALRELTRAERLLSGRAGDAEQRARAALDLRRSSVLHRQGRLRQAYDVAARVAQLPPDTTDPLLRLDRARALLRLEMVASESGWPERFDLGEQALKAFDGLDAERDRAMLLGNLGVTLWESDDWTGARRRYTESIEAYRRAGDVLGAAIAANNAAEILCDQGHLDRAREAFTDARRVFRAAGHAWGVGCTASALGRVALRSGDLAGAAELLQEAVEQLDEIGSTLFAADARVRQVELALVAEEPDVAERASRVVSELAGREVGAVLPLTAARYHALALAGAGRVQEARVLVEGALARAVALPSLHEESLCLDLLLGLALQDNDEPDPSWRLRRDEVWERLGLVAPYRYPQVPGH